MLSEKLSNAVSEMGVSLDVDKQLQLLAYLDMLAKWNKAYNLTAVRDKEQMLNRHLVESLSLIPYIYGSDILDIGTGPGLPGIPLAIAFPEKKFTLVDSNGKKTRFLNQVKIELKLMNISVLQSRVEALKLDHQPEQIVSRAFKDIATTVKLLDHLWPAGTSLCLMKGPGVEQELLDLDIPVDFQIHELQIPGQQEYRCLAVINHRQ